jgi:hypothetical protein
MCRAANRRTPAASRKFTANLQQPSTRTTQTRFVVAVDFPGGPSFAAFAKGGKLKPQQSRIAKPFRPNSQREARAAPTDRRIAQRPRLKHRPAHFGVRWLCHRFSEMMRRRKRIKREAQAQNGVIERPLQESPTLPRTGRMGHLERQKQRRNAWRSTPALRARPFGAGAGVSKAVAEPPHSKMFGWLRRMDCREEK